MICGALWKGLMASQTPILGATVTPRAFAQGRVEYQEKECGYRQRE